MNKALIESKNLTKTYLHGENAVIALDQVSLTIQPHEFIAVYGPSGCGKSTLLHVFGTLDLPTSGTLKINEFDVATLSNLDLALLRQRIGFVFQDFNLIPRLTALENVELALKIQGDSTRTLCRQKALDALTKMNLSYRSHHRPSELSGGEQQRVAIARAIAQEPKILLMDEPTGNLDSKSRDQLIHLIQEIHKTLNMTIIIVTHDEAVAQFCHRKIQLRDGKIIADERTAPSQEVEIHS